VQQLWDDLHQRRSPKVAVLKLPPLTLLFQVNGALLGELRSEWKRAWTAAGFAVGRKAQGLVFHDTRRYARTNLSAVGVPDVVGPEHHRTSHGFDGGALQHHPGERTAGGARGRRPPDQGRPGFLR
jgi:hypothetical protein